MTREERKTYIKAFYATAIYGELEHLVDEVYGDFEEQLKAKDKEIERLKVELEESNEIIDDYAEVQAQMTP